MPKRTQLNDKDFSVVARQVVEQTIGEKLDGTQLDDPHAVPLGKRGGARIGKAHAANLTKRRLKAIGKKRAETRWERNP